MSQPTRYMQKQFKDSFDGEVCEFWTGEDGMLMTLVTKESESAARVLSEHWAFTKGVPFKPEIMRKGFVKKDWIEYGQNYNTGNTFMKKCWIETEEPTPFAVVIYDLETPI